MGTMEKEQLPQRNGLKLGGEGSRRKQGGGTMKDGKGRRQGQGDKTQKERREIVKKECNVTGGRGDKWKRCLEHIRGEARTRGT